MTLALAPQRSYGHAGHSGRQLSKGRVYDECRVTGYRSRRRSVDLTRQRPGRAPRAGSPGPRRASPARSRTPSGRPASRRTGARSASSCITSPTCTRWRSSWRRRSPRGKPVTGVTWDDVHEMNAGHAKEHDAVTRAAALELLRAQQRGGRGRDPRAERRGARPGRAGVAQRRCPDHLPVHARGPRGPAQLSPSGRDPSRLEALRAPRRLDRREREGAFDRRAGRAIVSAHPCLHGSRWRLALILGASLLVAHARAPDAAVRPPRRAAPRRGVPLLRGSSLAARPELRASCYYDSFGTSKVYAREIVYAILGAPGRLRRER